MYGSFYQKTFDYRTFDRKTFDQNGHLTRKVHGLKVLCRKSNDVFHAKQNWNWFSCINLFDADMQHGNFLVTYLCGTTTNIWLRPVQEDLSMTPSLEQSASNLWPLGPDYRCSPHPPTWISVFLDFSFQWVWLWEELFVVGLRVFWSCDQRSAICLSLWHGFFTLNENQKLTIKFIA
jgi:hypothetical protein